MKYLFAAVYVLVLLTQLPHVWAAYAALEAPDIPLAQYTAWGAAIAFELSTGVFTFRIVNGSRRRWTKRGLYFFIAASIVANGYYYRVFPFVFDFVMPFFAMLALPIALALFAEEFGTEVKREERAAKRAETKTERTETKAETEQAQGGDWDCRYPGCNYVGKSQQALAGHSKAHSNGRKREQMAARELQGAQG